MNLVLKELDFLNFFVGSIVLGPRMDRFRDESSKYISGHSIPLISLGGFILIFGFFAFNAGSQVSFNSLYDVICILGIWDIISLHFVLLRWT